MAEPGPPADVMKRHMESQRIRTTLPNEDLEGLKKEIMQVRLKALKVMKDHGGKVPEEAKAALAEQHDNLAQTRPTLFLLAASPDEKPDISPAIEMVDIMVEHKRHKTSVNDASRKMWNHLADRLNYPQAKEWITRD